MRAGDVQSNSGIIMERAAILSDEAAGHPEVASRRTLLYVEDNPATMQLIEQLIARRPELRLLKAVNGTLGLEIARDCQPTVILLDINLPGLSGTDTFKLLRKDPRTAHIPVMALSGDALPHSIKNGLKLGFFRYLTKPIKVNDLTEALNAALDFAEIPLRQRK